MNLLNSALKIATPMITKVKVNSPTLLLIAGTTAVVTGTALAVKGGLELDRITDQHAETLDRIADAKEDENLPEYTEEKAEGDVVRTYYNTGRELVKTFAPAVALVGLGIGCFFWSNGIMKHRNLLLAGTVTALEQSFQQYRQRVIEEFGEDKDQDYRTGVYRSEEKVKITDPETGKKKTVKKEVINVDEQRIDLYTRIYDDGNPGWTKDPERTFMHLKGIQKIFQDQYDAWGYVYFSEVLKELGYKETAMSRNCGWFNDENSDGRIDFGFGDLSNPATVRFINGEETGVLLNFNCDGFIADRVEKMHSFYGRR